jgi:hypothetical protein
LLSENGDVFALHNVDEIPIQGSSLTTAERLNRLRDDRLDPALDG